MTPKTLKKLADKKYRTETGLFLVEGEKSIRELLHSNYVIDEIFGTDLFLEDLNDDLVGYEQNHTKGSVRLVSVTEDALGKMGTLQTNNRGIAVAKLPQETSLTSIVLTLGTEIVLALSDIRDPGNLGTIMRIADWFGVKHIVASLTTTDAYAPKTISASMGSFTRTTITYADLDDLLSQAHETNTPIMGAVLDGTNIHDGSLPSHGVLLLGSESHGISGELMHYVSHKMTIPKYGGAESLNVSVATGIILDALRNKSSRGN